MSEGPAGRGPADPSTRTLACPDQPVSRAASCDSTMTIQCGSMASAPLFSTFPDRLTREASPVRGKRQEGRKYVRTPEN